MKMTIFLSHAWNENAHNHNRVKQLSISLDELGVETWLDEDYISVGHIDEYMIDGIQRCSTFIVCLTNTYCKKIQRASRTMVVRDNCYKEWTFAMSMKKPIVPVAMEPEMLDPENWCDVIRMHLYGLYIVDATGKDFHSVATRLQRVCCHVKRRQGMTRVGHKHILARSQRRRLMCCV